MCTVVVSIGSSPAWPLLFAANRDERLDRASRPPACHWPDAPDVFGGLDVLAGGTWLAINRQGVVAAVLNRSGTLGPAPGKRSRGELPLIALRHRTARSAANALAALDGGAWRSFNMIVGDVDGAYYVRGLGDALVDVHPLTQGVHMVTAQDLDDVASPRLARHLPRFRTAPPPNPPDWATWPSLLSDRQPPAEAAINVPSKSGFGTVSSALIALSPSKPTQFRVSPTAPIPDSYHDVAWPDAWGPRKARGSAPGPR
jgi:hypothetical protein